VRSRLAGSVCRGGTHYLCPGVYQGNFTASVAVSLIGAGEGAYPTTDSILNANGSGQVLLINAGVGPVELLRLRVTGGSSPGRIFDPDGGGISHLGTTLRMTDCTVAGNSVVAFGGGGLFIDTTSTLEMTRCTVRDNHVQSGLGGGNGGGITTSGTTTLTDCLIENNSAEVAGGGISVDGGTTSLLGTATVQGNHADAHAVSSRGGGIDVNTGTLIIAETCRVTRNTAAAGFGGGIFNNGGTVTLQGGANPSPIVVDNCQENCAGPGGVPTCSTVPPAGSCP
jgi:hypothetical protein